MAQKFNETVSALISSPEIGVLDVVETAVAIVFNHICENGLIGWYVFVAMRRLSHLDEPVYGFAIQDFLPFSRLMKSLGSLSRISNALNAYLRHELSFRRWLMLCRIGSREGMVIFYGNCVIAVGGGCRLTVRGSSS
jgi:hypothetical protein